MARRSLFVSAESKDAQSSVNFHQENQDSFNCLLPLEHGETVYQVLSPCNTDDPPPLPNLTIQNSFSDESAYSSQVSDDVPPVCGPSAGEADNNNEVDHDASVVVVERSDADGDNDRQSQVVHRREKDRLPEKLAPIFRMGRRKTEDKGPQQPPKKVQKEKQEKNSARPNREGLTTRKLAGSKRTTGKTGTVVLSCNLEGVVAYSPGSKKRKSSPGRSTSPKRSRSPSPESATSCPVKQPASGLSKLLISRTSQGEYADRTVSEPNDCAPFSQLVHIQQMTDNERLWCQPIGPTIRVCEGTRTRRGLSTTADPAVFSQVGNHRFPLLLETTDSQLPSQVLLQLPKALEQLDALQEAHPNIDVHHLFTKCVTNTGGVYTSQIALSESALHKPHGHKNSPLKEGQSAHHRGQKRKKQRQRPSASTDFLELKCSINVQQIRVGDKMKLLARTINPTAQLKDGTAGGTTSEDVPTPVAASASGQESPARDSAIVVNLCSPEPALQPCTVSSSASKQQTLPSKEANLKETVQSFDHWSSSLAPQKAVDVLGNSCAVTAILSWLQRWKKKMQPTTTSKPPAAAQAAGGKGNGSVKVTVLDTSDSDFESPKKKVSRSSARKRQRMEDSDSDWLADEEEEEEDDHYKVMLLLGPPGSGKTAAVYACAQDLGYKVLEMNASSQRSRSQVMSHLMEASLSHQVVKTSNTLSNFFPPSTQPKEQCPTGNKGKPARKGIASFFKTVSPKDSTDKEKLESGDVAKTLGKEVMSSKPGCANVHLAKTGLILLEDVDVLFDDHDGGFWSSVYDVIEASRKPIIMTTTDETLELGCESLRVTFSAPSSTDLSVYLQVLALSKGLQLGEVECQAMTDLQHGDIRRCIMNAQLWFSFTTNMQAHGGRDKDETEPVPQSEENVLLSSELQDNCTAAPSSTWLLTRHLGVEVYNDTGSECSQGGSTGLGLSVRTADLAARKHSAMQQQGIDVIYPLYEKQLMRLGGSKDEERRVPSCSLPEEQTDGTVSAVTVKEQMKSLLWCSSQMSSLDVIRDASSKWYSHPSNVTPWWSVDEQDSLIDDHRNTAIESQVLSEIRTLGDVLLLDLVKSRAALPSTTAQVDTLTELGSLGALTGSIALRRNLDSTMWQQHEAWESCSTLFSLHHFVSRRVVSLDLLPWLRNMCSTECRRKEARLKRRYRHYFHYSPVEEDVLNALPQQSGLNI